MTKEEKEAVLHCLRAMIDEELCEECPLWGTTGTDHCEKDCVRLAIEELEQEPCKDAISRQAVLKIIDGWYEQNRDTDNIEDLIVLITYMDSVNPQKPKSECEHDHEILKAYSDGANAVLDNVRAEIESKYESIPDTFHDYETGFTDALEWVLSIIDKYKAEGSDKK